MGRQRTRARNARLGEANPNFKSKTSPSAIQARQKKKKIDHLNHIYPRRHVKRTELKSSLTQSLGLPPETLFIFRKANGTEGQEIPHNTVTINKGTVVVLNSIDLSVVLVVRCTPFSTMPSDVKHLFNHSFSTSYLHAHARYPCKTHNLVAPLEQAGEYCGWMGCCGWRGGSEKGFTLGMCLNDYHKVLPNNS